MEGLELSRSHRRQSMDVEARRTLQALEAMKLLVGFGEPLVGRLLLIDAFSTRFRELKVRRDPACTVCGSHAG